MPTIHTALPAVHTALPTVLTLLPAGHTVLPAVYALLPTVHTQLPAVGTALPAVQNAGPRNTQADLCMSGHMSKRMFQAHVCAGDLQELERRLRHPVVRDREDGDGDLHRQRQDAVLHPLMHSHRRLWHRYNRPL